VAWRWRGFSQAQQKELPIADFWTSPEVGLLFQGGFDQLAGLMVGARADVLAATVNPPEGSELHAARPGAATAGGWVDRALASAADRLDFAAGVEVEARAVVARARAHPSWRPFTTRAARGRVLGALQPSPELAARAARFGPAFTSTYAGASSMNELEAALTAVLRDGSAPTGFPFYMDACPPRNTRPH
jgi:hypothetical protein